MTGINATCEAGKTASASNKKARKTGQAIENPITKKPSKAAKGAKPMSKAEMM